MESRPAAALREEQTSRGRHLPWQRPEAGTARLQFEGRAEAGAGPGLSPHPPRGRQRRVRTGSVGEDQGRGEGRASRAKSCMERQGKVSSLTAEQAPEEPSDIETICEGFGRRERGRPGQPEDGELLFLRVSGSWAPPEPPGGAVGLSRQRFPVRTRRGQAQSVALRNSRLGRGSAHVLLPLAPCAPVGRGDTWGRIWGGVCAHQNLQTPRGFTGDIATLLALVTSLLM